ncbi:hypothetical protein PMAYCL1PPCAC_28650, partial [Pristionchus mayeri]
KIMIVGFAGKNQKYVSSSNSGESYIYESEWKIHGNLQLGDVYRATLTRGHDVDVPYKVVKLINKVDIWKGVQVDVEGTGVRVELNGKIVDRRESCYALETIPFGLVTYPTDLGIKSVPGDVRIGDHLRVRINRFKECK